MKKLALVIVILLAGVEVGLSFQNSNDWIRYNSAAGRYSVLLPAQPTEGTQESATADGTKFTQYKAALVEGNAVFLIGYFDHVPGTVFSLDKARDGMLEAVKGTLVSETAISLGGSPGRELKVVARGDEGMEFLLRAKFYDVDKRVYVLEFIVPKAEDNSAAAAKSVKFFDSFQVAKTP